MRVGEGCAHVCMEGGVHMSANACGSQRRAACVYFNCSLHFAVIKIYFFMHMNVLPLCMSVYHMGDWCPQRSELGLESPKLELQPAVSSYVGARNGHPIPLKDTHLCRETSLSLQGDNTSLHGERHPFLHGSTHLCMKVPISAWQHPSLHDGGTHLCMMALISARRRPSLYEDTHLCMESPISA